MSCKKVYKVLKNFVANGKTYHKDELIEIDDFIANQFKEMQFIRISEINYKFEPGMLNREERRKLKKELRVRTI